MNNFKITPIEQEGQRVLTTAQLAEAYGTDSKTISYNFNHNKSRYIEGVHYYCLTGEEKRKFCNRREFHDGSKATVFYLWTEKGALLHAKSLNTDKAWEIYDFLVDTYFRVKAINNSYFELLEIYNNLNFQIETLNKNINKLDKKIYALEKNFNNRVNSIIQNIEKSIIENSYCTV
ncbi:MAG: ORF6N domain-containing protein, partial [Ruminococcus sp.]|nr:ORF6N domain-containing protein [Ruminococcus sp.]